MSTITPDRQELLQVPDSLKKQLTDFRGKVWSTKMAEAIALAIAALLVAFLTVFLVDRFWDTPQSVRMVIFFTTLAVCMVVPWALHRWVWRHRHLKQLACLLRVREPNIGDQLLGVIELSESDAEQARSRTLCAAAIDQVAKSAEKQDLNKAAPRSRFRLWGAVVAVTAGIAAILAVFAGPAAKNAFARLAAPWIDTPRYTFTALEQLPESMVVPHGETVSWQVTLAEDSRWSPEKAFVTIEGMQLNETTLQDGRYTFELPARTEPTDMLVQVGDFYQSVTLEPKMRPELIGASATVQLPDYLQWPDPLEEDVRSGTLSVVQGSRATLTATASRELASATINESDVAVEKDAFSSNDFAVETGNVTLTWRDHDGLAGREPFQVQLRPMADEPPSVVTQDLQRQAVLLVSEQVNFRIMSADDFGVKRLGVSWRGLDERLAKPAEGEKVLAVGNPQQSSIQVPGTFSGASYGIDPQPVEVQFWVEDYLPGRERVYSTPHVFFILTPEQHAAWITNQMSKWHRAALDVRDKELRLHERNKQLRKMTAQELADDEMRKEIRRQSAAESSNGRKLSALSKMGKDLLRQASRNEELGVGHLEKWAEMLEILEDISSNRMPSVSELLDKASAKPKLARGNSPPKEQAPKAGKNRSKGGGSGNEEEEKAEEKQPKVPSLVDAESSQQPKDEKEGDDAPSPPGGKPRLTLPTTTITGPPKDAEACPPGGEEEEIDQAIEEQADLLAEFEKVADELNQLLANMEGSTLVKRLKAASREQNQVADQIGERIDSVFGSRTRVDKEDQKVLANLSDVEKESVQKISYIMDDMQAYYERRRMTQFKDVLEDMKDSEVLRAMEDLSDEIPKEHGMSIAQTEYWSDTLDRWADDLVDPAGGGM